MKKNSIILAILLLVMGCSEDLTGYKYTIDFPNSYTTKTYSCVSYSVTESKINITENILKCEKLDGTMQAVKMHRTTYVRAREIKSR